MKNFLLNRKVFLTISIIVYVLAILILGFEVKAFMSKSEIGSFGTISIVFLTLLLHLYYWERFSKNRKKTIK